MGLTSSQEDEKTGAMGERSHLLGPIRWNSLTNGLPPPEPDGTLCLSLSSSGLDNC